MSNKPTGYSLQYLVNLLADMSVDPPVIRIGLVGKAVDGPLSGSYVNISAGYNSDTGNYELLTAGSGGTSTPVTKDGLWNSTNTLWNDTSINWNQT